MIHHILLAVLVIALCWFPTYAVGSDIHPQVEFTTTKGSFIVEVYPEWAPIGAKHFLELVEDGFYTDIAFYRSVDRFLTQFGISDNPDMKHWHFNQIEDDVAFEPQRLIDKHVISYAGGGPNTRSTQLFISYEYLDFLGKEPWEIPFGRVVDGHEVVDSLYKGYGDIVPFGNGPDQQVLFNEGNGYIRSQFPKTDFILHSKIINADVAERCFATLK